MRKAKFSRGQVVCKKLRTGEQFTELPRFVVINAGWPPSEGYGWYYELSDGRGRYENELRALTKRECGRRN